VLPVAAAGAATAGVTGTSGTIATANTVIFKRLRGRVMAISFVRLAGFRMLAWCVRSVSSQQLRRASDPSHRLTSAAECG